jgi:hypothetical protein
MYIMLRSALQYPISQLSFGYYPSPYGLALLAFDGKGYLYALYFVLQESIHAEETLINSFAEAVLTSNPSGAAQLEKSSFLLRRKVQFLWSSMAPSFNSGFGRHFYKFRLGAP